MGLKNSLFNSSVFNNVVNIVALVFPSLIFSSSVFADPPNKQDNQQQSHKPSSEELQQREAALIKQIRAGKTDQDTINREIEHLNDPVVEAPAPKGTTIDYENALELVKSTDTVDHIKANIKSSLKTGPKLFDDQGNLLVADSDWHPDRFSNIKASDNFLKAYWNLIPDALKDNSDQFDERLCTQIRDLSAWGLLIGLGNVMNWKEGDTANHLKWAHIRLTLEAVIAADSDLHLVKLPTCLAARPYVRDLWKHSLEFRRYEEKVWNPWLVMPRTVVVKYAAWMDGEDTPISMIVAAHDGDKSVGLARDEKMPSDVYAHPLHDIDQR